MTKIRTGPAFAAVAVLTLFRAWMVMLAAGALSSYVPEVPAINLATSAALVLGLSALVPSRRSA